MIGSRTTGKRLEQFWVGLIVACVLGLWATSKNTYAQTQVPDEILDILDEHCAFAGCHIGPGSQKGMDLSEEAAAASLINVKSVEMPQFMRVKPGEAQNSYIIKKLMGAPEISGERMPKGSKPLTREQIAAIAQWIQSLPAQMPTPKPVRKYAEAFPGWSISNLPTAETPLKGAFTYRIAHRFKSPVKDGFDRLFGLDGGAFMMTQLFFPVTNDLTLTVARNALNATFEFGGKWRLLRQKTDGSVPVSAAFYTGVDWATIKELVDPESAGSQYLSRTAGDRFSWFGQLVLSKQFADRISLLAVPGVLLNGNVAVKNEDALLTFGLGGRAKINDTYALFAELIPILSGDETAAVVGGPALSEGKRVYYDTFTAGIEIKAGGHVFHVFVSNSAGNTTSQYMSGGNFDFAGGDFRLGFNIYRILKYPFSK